MSLINTLFSFFRLMRGEGSKATRRLNELAQGLTEPIKNSDRERELLSKLSFA